VRDGGEESGKPSGVVGSAALKRCAKRRKKILCRRRRSRGGWRQLQWVWEGKKKDEEQIGESVPPSNKRIPLKFLKAYMEFQTFILAHKGHV
jgi:hypothetical protein